MKKIGGWGVGGKASAAPLVIRFSLPPLLINNLVSRPTCDPFFFTPIAYKQFSKPQVLNDPLITPPKVVPSCLERNLSYN